MEQTRSFSRGDVFLTCIGGKFHTNETIVDKHALVRILSGEMRVLQGEKTYVFHAGDTVLFSRFQLARFTKCPENGKPYKSVSIYFRQEVLQEYYAAHHAMPAATHNLPGIEVFHEHPLLESLLTSVLPYFNLADELPPAIAAVKVTEAITILRTIDPRVDTILGNFEPPGKIDLADFMEKHYMFNMSLMKFSYLTGRSLTSFKRDFQKVFNTSPQRWLTQKRLEQAHYQIFELKRKPSDVYFEVGFENLSHFSYAFKKRFGYNAGSVRR